MAYVRRKKINDFPFRTADSTAELAKIDGPYRKFFVPQFEIFLKECLLGRTNPHSEIKSPVGWVTGKKFTIF